MSESASFLVAFESVDLAAFDGEELNSLKRGMVVQAVVVIFGVVGLRRVNKEQAGSPETLRWECINECVESANFLAEF